MMATCNTLPLFVKLDGETIRVDVNLDWSILQLKQHLYLHSNKHPDTLKVIFAGSELPNALLLKNCQLAHGTIVHVIVTSTKTRQNSINQVETPSFTSTTNLIGPSLNGIKTQKDDRRQRFYIYCKSSCQSVKAGKLRVRCKTCKDEAFQINTGPNNWEDVLLTDRIAGSCNNNVACIGNIAEFFFKCSEENKELENHAPHTCIPLPLLRTNVQDVQCLICTDVSDIVLIFTCNDSHVICIDCFANYCRSKLDNRQFMLVDPIGYTLSCPGLGGSCSDSYVKEIHHFMIAGARQYERYKNFATEEFVLQNGGIFCPGEGCGNGILMEDLLRKVVCYRSRGGCGMVFCRNCHSQYHEGECDASTVPSNADSSTNDVQVNHVNAQQARWRNEVMSRDTISKMTKLCPGCRTPTEKSGGCNHMTCPRCQYQWCWICQIEWGRSCEADHWFLAR